MATGRCAWCRKTFRGPFEGHLDKHRSCALLANALVSQDAEVRAAAYTIRGKVGLDREHRAESQDF